MTDDDRNGPPELTDPWTHTHAAHAVIDEQSAAVVAAAAESLTMSRSPLALGDALVALHALVSLEAQIHAELPDVVADALDQEHSFEEIARQLSVTPAAAHRRYAAYAKRRQPLAID